MPKRSNDNGQMRREEVEALDNSDDDDAESEVAGVFSKASDDVLSTRRVVKGRRLVCCTFGAVIAFVRYIFRCILALL